MGREPEADDGTWPALGGEGANVYEVIFREMEDAVFLVDVERTDEGYEFVFRRNNAAHRRRTGLSEDELRGQTPRELLGDEQGAAVAANYRRCVEREEAIEYEETLDLPGGRSDWQTKLTPVMADGRVTQLVGVGRDVTERKAQQRAFERTARRFETVLETMTAAAFLKDTSGRYRLMNQACRDLLGVEEGAVDGVTDEELFPPETAERARADDRRVIETGERIEVEETVPTTEGHTVRLTRKAPVYGDDGEVTAVCGVSTDITAQKRREEELRRLTERFELAVEGANIGVWDWDMTTDAVDFNENWARMLGHSLEDIDPHLDAWESRVHPDDIGAASDALEAHIAGESEYYETEHRMRTADGDWKWIRDVGEIVERDADGEPVRAVGIHLDIDDRKQYERTLERQRDSLEVLNQIVRHDVRNALQFVLEYGELLDDHVGEEGEAYRRRIVQAGREAIDITRTAGDVTRVLLRSETCHVPVAVRPVLEEQIADVRAGHERAVVSVEGALPDAEVRADDMLESVFRNVLTNAVVHNDEDVPEVTVSASADDETVRVRIADNGPGIPDDQKERVFREGEKGLDSEGSGLGLYLVRTLVERYGGDVRVADNDPKGSVFTVELRRDD
ncbi:PAS domain S-box protein [Halarchaeum sp. CBA1220]|uniref:sensor histidine kinase n=1 Tax=Halarchaeum sp. CBA1220 TaxID=1853682 RepID=UPI000F3AA6E0|nr:PAS domain-containing sensor histidine kinase [Halarchaeum sp. CBA1220]QLC33439.1 PAS domain S-box protein [Halarchaeum sp. CBA1220]